MSRPCEPQYICSLDSKISLLISDFMLSFWEVGKGSSAFSLRKRVNTSVMCKYKMRPEQNVDLGGGYLLYLLCSTHTGVNTVTQHIIRQGSHID